MDFDKIGIQVLFVAMTSMCVYDIKIIIVLRCCALYTAEENRDLLSRSGFFQKCSKRWLFPSMQDAVEHAKHGLPLVCPTTLHVHYHPCLNHVTHITTCLNHVTNITVSLKEKNS